jgi:hypothetical protein
MARRTLAATAFVALTALIAPTFAFAHAGNPNFESVVRTVSPSIPGFTVDVLNGDDRLEVANRGTSVVTIAGYNKEPYLRLSPDGTVAVNTKSPALYLNADARTAGTVPPFADAAAPPQWKVVEHTGRYEFHDHRMHWMGTTTPTQVKNTAKRTKVFDWRVPVQTPTVKASIDGQLFWRGSSGGPPAAAFVGLALIVLLGGAAVVVVRRRRAAAEGGPAAGAPPREEAW